jgi:hypothetical protein
MNSLKGKAVHFDERHLHVELEDGRIISTPIAWYPELQRATLNQLAGYRFICRGTGIEWPELDYHLSIEAMFAESRETRAA